MAPSVPVAARRPDLARRDGEPIAAQAASHFRPNGHAIGLATPR
jgi:hypothetical protein